MLGLSMCHIHYYLFWRDFYYTGCLYTQHFVVIALISNEIKLVIKNYNHVHLLHLWLVLCAK